MKKKAAHWSKQKEKSIGYWHIKFMHILFKFFPIIILRLLAFPVGFFYFLFSKNARAESKRFLVKASDFTEDPRIKKKCRSFFGPLRHIISFSLSLIEKIESWGGRFQYEKMHFSDDMDNLRIDLEENRGVFLITSHLGNVELIRGLVSFDRTGVSRKVPVTAVMEMKVTENFNRMLKELNPESVFDVIGSEDIGPQTAVLFEETLASGGIVTIAGDRTSGKSGEKNLRLPFLGKEALFPYGIFHLAVLMKAPVYFVFALRRGGDLSVRPEYDMFVHKNSFPPDCSRKERAAFASALASSFAALLERYCKKQPFQWYNFYDFWAEGE